MLKLSLRTLSLLVAALGLLAACGGTGGPAPPEGAIEVGSFYVVEDDGLEFDEIPAVCETESVDDGALLAGTPFESRRFPDWTRVYRCKEDGHVTGAVVLSSPGYRRYEFTGLPVVEWSPGGESEYSTLEIAGMPVLVVAQTVPDIIGHDTAIYVIEQMPDGDAPGRMAELRYVSSTEYAVCFMRQILDLDAPGPCPA